MWMPGWRRYVLLGSLSIVLIMLGWIAIFHKKHRKLHAARAVTIDYARDIKPILRNPPLMQLQLIWFFTMMAFVMLEATFALYLHDIFGYGPREVGWFFGFIGVIIVIVQGGLIGRLTSIFGEWALVIAGPLLVSAAMAISACVLLGLPMSITSMSLRSTSLRQSVSTDS